MCVASNKHLPGYQVMNGRVLWLTGLSGAGKSTIAQSIQKELIKFNITPLILDGDLVRDAINDPHWGFDQVSRLAGSFRYAKLAYLAANQGLTVIVPTISMFHEVHDWNRNNIQGYFEVYLRTKEQTRRNRDPKILYVNSRNGVEGDMVGIDHLMQAPLSPNLLIDNDAQRNTEEINELAAHITERFLYDTAK
tara:strand:+ start:6462 stop:7040 length:579 start_codon:yes stop_codon:yes gene_type:complete